MDPSLYQVNFRVPLVLAQFVCSHATSSLNVAISSIATDLGTSVSGVQPGITVFTLVRVVGPVAGILLPARRSAEAAEAYQALTQA